MENENKKEPVHFEYKGFIITGSADSECIDFIVDVYTKDDWNKLTLSRHREEDSDVRSLADFYFNIESADDVEASTRELVKKAKEGVDRLEKEFLQEELELNARTTKALAAEAAFKQASETTH